MGLTQALNTSLSGLKATQISLGIVSGNVANSQTPGYVAKSVTQIETSTGDSGNAVEVTSISRLQIDYSMASGPGCAFAPIPPKSLKYHNKQTCWPTVFGYCPSLGTRI